MTQLNKDILKSGWFWVAILVLFLSCSFIIVSSIYEWTCIWSKVIGGILSFITTSVSFYCGFRSHMKQNQSLEHIEPLIKEIYKKIKSNAIEQIGNITLTENVCAVYVKLTLYAMYHAYTNRSKNHIKCRTISKENPMFIFIIVETIFVAFKSEDLMGRIADDGCLVIDNFNVNVPMDCTDSRKILRTYEHNKNYNMIKSAINRINNACGMKSI